jgi:CRISPR-associated protein Cas1
MTTLYLTEPRSLVKKDGDTLLVSIPADKQRDTEARKVRVPMMKVTQVVVMGDSTVTTPALLALLEQKAEISFCDYHGRFKGQLASPMSRNGQLRIAQYAAHVDYGRRVALAREFVAGKLANQRTLLLRSNRKLEDDAIKAAAATMQGVLADVQQVVGVAEPADPVRPQADSAMGRLQGLEGAGSAAYFGVFSRLLRHDLGFQRRVRRPPTDPVNALLSFGYTLLLNNVLSAVAQVGMDPYVGYLHSSQYGKPALALDLMEEFRTPVVDSVVVTVINNRIVQAEHFSEELGAYRLSDAGRRRFLEAFEERLATSIEHPVFGYKASYRRCLELQERLAAKLVMGEIEQYTPFRVR